MRYFEEYKIDGKPLLVPDGDVEMSFSDLDDADSGRDEAGFMHRIVARYRVGSWKFSYFCLTAQAYRYLRSLFAGKGEFTFTYRDADGETVSTRAYCANDSITYQDAALGLYRNFQFTVIEC